MEEKYCTYCGELLVECHFGDTIEERMGCIRDNCPGIIAFRKNLAPTKDGYPKDIIDYVKAKAKFNTKTGERL